MKHPVPLPILLISLLVATGCASAATNTNSSVAVDTTTTYSLSDISAHNSKSDCWMAIDNKVYNVTDFISQHPGRNEILKGCGIDATDLFTGKSAMGQMHSTMAKTMLSKFQVGVLQ